MSKHYYDDYGIRIYNIPDDLIEKLISIYRKSYGNNFTDKRMVIRDDLLQAACGLLQGLNIATMMDGLGGCSVDGFWERSCKEPLEEVMRDIFKDFLEVQNIKAQYFPAASIDIASAVLISCYDYCHIS